MLISHFGTQEPEDYLKCNQKTEREKENQIKFFNENFTFQANYLIGEMECALFL